MTNDFGSFILTIVTSPVLYCGLVGAVVAMYVVWRLCRQSYLLPEKQFNLLWLGWLAGYGAVVVGGWARLWIGQGEWLSWDQWLWGLLPLAGWEIWQSASLILLTYIAVGWVAVYYIRSIRYPLWKMLDMAAVGLMVWQVFLVIGWLIRWSGWPNMLDWMMLGWSGGLLIVIGWLYKWLATGRREGVVAAVQVAGVFGWLVTSQLCQLAWQGQISVVELIAAGVGLLGGLGLLVYRLWRPSTAIRVSPASAGVSQLKQAVSRLSMIKVEQSPQAEAVKQTTVSEVQEAKESSVVGRSGVAVLNQEEFAPPVNTSVKKLHKRKSGKKKDKN